ncbi:hypothetical protein [Sphingobium sp. BS19]|uniref:hypothetical protein n=1 Tax=Sphingobium sp. BS19 TaxID=3018973 RepID=UPI0022EDC38C|nr:hypothetical protein [Sphingobium sp. BS19]GLI99161.1 hypothetical protein Sbs19_29790 [Sphingobium sp. BS19]
MNNFRISKDYQGFNTLRTGDIDDAPDSDLIASVWDDDSLPLLANAPALLALVHQYRSDLLYPPSDDSRERRIAAIDAVLAAVGNGENGRG